MDWISWEREMSFKHSWSWNSAVERLDLHAQLVWATQSLSLPERKLFQHNIPSCSALGVKVRFREDWPSVMQKLGVLLLYSLNTLLFDQNMEDTVCSSSKAQLRDTYLQTSTLTNFFLPLKAWSSKKGPRGNEDGILTGIWALLLWFHWARHLRAMGIGLCW